MAKRSISKGVIKDIAIVAIAVIVIWIGLQAAFGTQNPFYVVASGSMIPVLQVYDIIVIQGHESFEEVHVGCGRPKLILNGSQLAPLLVHPLGHIAPIACRSIAQPHCIGALSVLEQHHLSRRQCAKLILTSTSKN